MLSNPNYCSAAGEDDLIVGDGVLTVDVEAIPVAVTNDSTK